MGKDEPQSYGSQKEWVKGDTGGQVNRQKSEPAPEHEAFYDERRESEANAAHQGGRVSEIQMAENRERVGRGTAVDVLDVKKVTDADGGAVRDSYFKQRDYGK